MSLDFTFADGKQVAGMGSKQKFYLKYLDRPYTGTVPGTVPFESNSNATLF